ncbi:signal peptidase I [Amycolatopsis taiwanensis]
MTEIAPTVERQEPGRQRPRIRWRLPSAVLVIGVLVVVGSFALLPPRVFSAGKQATDSMTPTIQSGDIVKVLPISGEDVRRGDIVIVKTDAWPDRDLQGVLLVKRVVALPGDAVGCCDPDGKLLVNGKAITEDYLAPDDPRGNSAFDDYDHYTVEVPEGGVFILGDNRGNSRDSRAYTFTAEKGSLPFSAIVGVVVLLNDKVLAPTHAFTDAGLPGEPHRFDRTAQTVAAVVPVAGGLVSLGGLVWLIVNLTARRPGKSYR